MLSLLLSYRAVQIDCEMTLDAFRVFDYALNNSAIQRLANIYGLNIPAPAPPTSYVFPNTTETTSLVGIVPRMPVFNGAFGQNPTTAPSVGSYTNYGWIPFDPTDTSANQQLHQGLIVLNGSIRSYVDLATTSGPNSCGLVLPIIGGAGSGTQNQFTGQNTRGMTIEMVFKLTAVMSWSKLLDLGTGGYLDSMAISWNGWFTSSHSTSDAARYLSVLLLTCCIHCCC